jgi:polyisoprenoid-binding protein YceI
MVWVLDKAQSTVEFSVRHLLTSTVRGRFTDFDADVRIDADEPARSYVRATIRTGSLLTGNHERDEQLRSPAFLDAASFPTIEFASEQAIQVSPSAFWLRGKLTIHGSTRDVVLEGRVDKDEPFQNVTRAAVFTARAEIDRRDFFRGRNSGTRCVRGTERDHHHTRPGA